MNKLLTSVALAAVIATPALAQSWNGTQRQARDPYAAYAAPFENGYQNGQRRSSNRSIDVYDTRGHYIGSDPDPAVRGQLLRDPGPGVND
jgi:hypothetical protein